MKQKKQIIKRLKSARDKQIKTGFAERHPEIYQDLLYKIEGLEKGYEYKIKDVTKKLIGTIGACIPVFHLQNEIINGGKITDKHMQKKIKEKRKFIDDLWSE